MAEIVYLGLLHPSPAGDYGVVFPDFPGFTTSGRTVAAAERKATRALRAHVTELRSSCQPIPLPTALEKIRCHPAASRSLLVSVSASARLRPDERRRDHSPT